MALGAEVIEKAMIRALALAQEAAALGEVPVGAVLLNADGAVFAEARNKTEEAKNPTLHAEIAVIAEACQKLGHRYLSDFTLVVTLEPCPMCAGALYWAQLGSLVFGASDSKRGYSIFAPNALHPQTNVHSGLLKEDCGKVITEFFKGLRAQKNA